MKNFFPLFLIFCFVRLQAQENGQPYRRAVSFNPLALAQIDFTVLPGYEYRFNQAVSFFGELGYTFASGYLGDQTSTKANGFLFRPSIKLYVNRRKNFYLQPQVFYKQVTHHLEEWVGRNCVNEIPSFEEFTNFRFRRMVYGANLVSGLVLPSVIRNSFLDLYLGLGIRRKYSKVMDHANSCYPAAADNWIIDESGWLPSAPAGIRLVFVLD